MTSCPNCNAELSDAVGQTQRCPVCDTLVDLGRTAAGDRGLSGDKTSAGQAAQPPDEDPTAARNVRAYLRTMVDLTQVGDDAPLDPSHPAAADQAAHVPEDDLEFELVDDDFESAAPSAAAISPQPGVDEDGDGPRTLGESDLTVAFVEEESPQDANSMATNAAGMTIDVGELPPDQMEMLTGMWSATISPEAKPGMTIKAAAGGSATQTHLVVKPRTLRPQNEPSPAGADYELLETIGQGGMGVVYAARQASIDRHVAIKMIRRDMAADTDQRQKFLSEAVVTGDLDHPNIVPIYDLGSNDAGALFYSMKRVHGTPWMKVIRQKGLDENLEILMKVADAVAFAHSRGVIHRDLKPENVMLGEFGEVLVMDWGLALLAPRFRHLGSITQSGGMGGTPAYMAPEMASGPLERIGTSSDVYLLGAILYEIITGRPPHAGKDVMSCLYAVARNEIQPTDRSGELVDIALKGMAGEQQDRYASVLDFQAAIRLYHSHSESTLLADRAQQDLTEAGKTRNYQDYARAVFGFQEAITLWDGNERARLRLLVARSAYADCAMAKGDLDLAASLLDAEEPSFVVLRERIASAQRERDARQQRLKFFVRAARALVATVVVVVAAAFFLIRAQRDRAVVAEREAVTSEQEATAQRDRAVAAEAEATSQATRARAAEAEATTKRDEAVAAEQQATDQRNRAVAAEEQARKDRDKAREAEKAEAALREQEEALRQQKEYEAYIAQIGLVASKIDENAFGYAAQLLDECPSPLRNWEWGRLTRLCRQSAQTFVVDGPIDAACYSPDGKRVLTGSWEGRARVWNVATGQPQFTLQHGMYVHAVAYSPDGRLIVTGSNDEEGELRIWDAESGALQKTFTDHTDAVLSVAFSRDGKRLLTSSYDNTARLWDVETDRQIRVFKGHSWWVWSAAFSPDESRIVTASQDGTSIVWSVASEERSAPFTGHAGPVYWAAFSPDGRHVATAGYDKRILVWRPDQVRAIDYSTLLAADNPREPPNYVTLVGHTAPVRCVRFSADGGRLVSGSHDNTVKLWDLAQGVCTQTLRGHAGWVRSCSFAPDGRSILSAGYDHQAKIWDPARYEEIRTLRGHDDALLAAAFSPDGGRVVTASRDRTAKIWDVADGEQITTLSEGHSFLVSTVAFSPDGRRVFTGAGDDTVRIWDAASGGELVTLENTGRGGVFALARDGKRILTGGDSGHARLWDAASGNLIFELVGRRADVTAAAISPDGSQLFTGDAKGRGWLWSAASGEQLHLLEGHSRKITAAQFLAGGKRLLTTSNDNSVGQWDTTTGRELTSFVLKHSDGVTALAVSRDGQFALTACADSHIRLWRIDPPRVVRDIDTSGCALSSVAFSPDQRRVLTACADNKVRLWDLTTGVEVRSARAGGAHDALVDTGRNAVWSAVFSPDGSHIASAGGNDAKLWQVDNGREVMAYSPHGAVAGAAFSPDGQRVATCSWDGTIKVWNATTGTVELKFVASHDKYVNSVVFSPDGARLLSASDDATAKIWDAATGALLLSLPADDEAEGHRESVRSARFSPDGKRIVTASSDKTARVWDAETGKPLVVLAGHDWAVLAASFSPDGTRVITGSEDNSARIWDVATGKMLFQLAGHTASVTGVAFSPDCTRAVTGGQDNAVKLWDATTGKEILHLKQHTQEVSSVAFSPDGKSLLTSSRDGSAILWPAVDWK